MPQRLLRPGLRQSKRWNRLPYFEQTFYVRIFSLVDDYARYDADSELLRSECFPFGDPGGNVIPLLTIDSGLLTLASSDMLFLYEFEQHRYLQLTRWKERVRSESKWPDPKKGKMLTNDSSCQQMSASPPSPSPSPSPSPTPTPLSAREGKLEERQRVYQQIESRLNLIYKRTDKSHWSYAEQQALVEVSRRPQAIEELVQICHWRDRMPPDDRRRFFPQSVNTLLSRWTESLDKARVQSPIPKAVSVKPAKPSTLKHFEPSPELGRKFREAAGGKQIS